MSSLPGTLQRRTRAVRTDDGALLHATVDGADDAPLTVVLAHGWTLSQASWDDVAALLAPRAAAGELRLVRYDQRGHGRSTWGAAADEPGGITIDRLGEDLAAVLDALAPEGPVVLGGHSMGGMTVMALAAAHPGLIGSRIRGVALVSTAAGGLRPEARTLRERAAARLTAPGLALALSAAGLVEAVRRRVPPELPRHRALVRDLLYGPDASDEAVLAGARLLHASSVRAYTAFLPALHGHDKREQLTALRRVPVEVLVGDGDKLTPERHSRVIAEALPGARLSVVPRTGHMLPQERPQLVAAALERLVAGAGGRVAA